MCGLVLQHVWPVAKMLLFVVLCVVQAVVAFDPPNNVTTYIQARGRARKAGSFYYWLTPDSQEIDPKKAVSRQMSKLQQYVNRDLACTVAT